MTQQHVAAANTPAKKTGQPKPFFQPKLSVNAPGDIYEQEADAMADTVMRMADTSFQQDAFFKPVNNTVHRKCQACEEEEQKLHRKESNLEEPQDGTILTVM